MKYYVQSFDANSNIDPTINNGLLSFLPGRVTSMAQADCVVIPVAYMSGGYRFNEDLLRLTKPVVLLDYLEFGWDAGDKPNILGTESLWQFSHLASEEWARLDAWVLTSPPALTFKRELCERDRSERMLPIEFPCRIPASPLQSKPEFDARPIEVFFSWGLSSPSRPRLHGQIFQNAHDNGIHVVDAWDQDNRFEGRTWATIHTPHYNRKPINEVMRWNERAKISVSLPGAGVKCFRHSEAPCGSIMALPIDELAWSIRWLHDINCFRIQPGREFETLSWYLEPASQLYDIYCASQENIDRYRSQRYATEYVQKEIEARL